MGSTDVAAWVAIALSTIATTFTVLGYRLARAAESRAGDSADRSAASAERSAASAEAALAAELRGAIAQAWTGIHTLALEIGGPLGALRAKGKRTKADDRELERLDTLVRSAQRGWLNAYETACGMYLDGKVDESRFRKDYEDEIRNLVTGPMRDDGLLDVGSPYTAILAVAKEWFDKENRA